jgi:hypothetical protein
VGTLTEVIIRNLNEKLGWAERSHQRIVADLKNEDNVKDHFWSYLTAVQTAWFYFSRWVKENPTIIESANVLIDRWKIDNLNNDERDSWDLLRNLRNEDTHDNPVSANYSIVKKLLISANGEFLVTADGKFFVTESQQLQVEYNHQQYDIASLVVHGLSCLNKLIQFISSHSSS